MSRADVADTIVGDEVVADCAGAERMLQLRCRALLLLSLKLENFLLHVHAVLKLKLRLHRRHKPHVTEEKKTVAVCKMLILETALQAHTAYSSLLVSVVAAGAAPMLLKWLAVETGPASPTWQFDTAAADVAEI